MIQNKHYYDILIGDVIRLEDKTELLVRDKFKKYLFCLSDMAKVYPNLQRMHTNDNDIYLVVAENVSEYQFLHNKY